MTRDEFRNALHILITDSTDIPTEEVSEELENAVRWVEDLERFEAEHQPARAGHQ